jgi:2-keto-4-pentenoate hydratase
MLRAIEPAGLGADDTVTDGATQAGNLHGTDPAGPARAIAAAFVGARRAARTLDAYPGERPTTMAAAYAIQDQALAIDGRVVAGWKVGRINPPLDSALGANRLAGPIFGDTVVAPAPGEVPQMPVFAGGFAAAEAEFLLHIAPGHGQARPADDAATLLVIDEVRLGIEIASSPWRGINADGPAVTASDFGNNHGLVIGPAVADWAAVDLCAVPVSTAIDGVEVGSATAAAMLDGPLGAVRFLMDNLRSRAIDFSGGTWVSTGAVTGVHPVATGQAVVATFGALGEVRCTISPARAT